MSQQPGGSRSLGSASPSAVDDRDDGVRVRRTSAWVVGVVGLLIGIAIALRSLIPAGMDPSTFLALGEDAPVQTGYARRLLGDVETRPEGGHDGKFFFIQANDPWYLDPARNAPNLDLPFHRGERMLFPMLAGGFGAFPASVIVWSLLVTNLIALGFGAAIAAKLASLWGASTWLGLSVPLNLGLLYEIMSDGSGVVAFVFCLAAVYALERERIFVAPPFVGLVQAIGPWTRSPDQLLISVTILVLIGAFVVLALRTRLPLAWGALPFVALAWILSVDVFLDESDLSRAIAPVFTAAPFLLFVPDVGRRLAGDRS